MQARERIDTLTSLRFVAAAMIVVGHAHPVFGSLGLATSFSLAQGVSFFFVLSGFILAYNYPTLANRPARARFLRARVARIWPAHLAAIGLMFLLTQSANLAQPTAVGKGLVVVANFFLVQSWLPLRDIYLSLNGVAWSISTEFFFYLVFPFLIAGLAGNWRAKLIGLMLVLALHLWLGMAWQVTGDEAARFSLMGLLYVNPLPRLLEFFLGILTCLALPALRARITLGRGGATLVEVVVIALVAGSLWLTPRLVAFLGGTGPAAEVASYYLSKSGSAIVFALLIAAFALQKGGVSTLLRARLPVLLGEISFALYLVHTSVLAWYQQHAAGFAGLPAGLAYAAYWVAALMIAYWIYRLVELPCRKILVEFPAVAFRQWPALLAGRSQRAPAILAIVCLAWAVRWQPAATPCAEAECGMFAAKAAVSGDVEFGHSARLLAADLRATPEGLYLKLLWQPLESIAPDSKIAIHVVNERGEILWQNDYVPRRAAGLARVEKWLDELPIPEYARVDGARIAIAMYRDPAHLFPVTASRTDWGGRRLLLMALPRPGTDGRRE